MAKHEVTAHAKGGSKKKHHPYSEIHIKRVNGGKGHMVTAHPHIPPAKGDGPMSYSPPPDPHVQVFDDPNAATAHANNMMTGGVPPMDDEGAEGQSPAPATA